MSTGEDEISAGRGGDVVSWHKMVEAINAVCQLTVVEGPGTTGAKKGSGCLVRVILNEKKTAAILTNHHVVKNEEIAVKTLATFNFDGCGGEPFVIKLHPDIVFKTSIGEDYDYSLVGVRSEDVDSLRTRFGVRPLELQRIRLHDLVNVKIVQIAQHPRGEPRRFSVGGVCELQSRYILYDADTSAGSSGSPVFYACNENYRVLAVHKSGGVEASSCKEPVNKGVLINVILDHLTGGSVHVMQSKKHETKDTVKFTPQETVRIGNRIPDNWENIALATGKFNDKETAIIRLNNNYNDSAWKATKMLNNYQRRLGTREDLASALKEFGELDLAEKVLSKYYQTNSS